MTAVAELPGGCEQSLGDRFEVTGYGIDDVTFGFDLTGSRSLTRLNEAQGLQTRRGKKLGERASWGKFEQLLGRSVCFWKSDTLRLYVQAKLTPDGSLCTPSRFVDAYRGLLERMAIMGLVSYEPAWVTRVDVAVDAQWLTGSSYSMRLKRFVCRTDGGRDRLAFRGRRSTSRLARASM